MTRRGAGEQALRVCGIDPGLRHTGWGIVDIDGSHLTWVADGVISPDASLDDVERLVLIHDELQVVLSRYAPDRAVIEQIFVSRNGATTLKLGMARGVAMLALGQSLGQGLGQGLGQTISEISPRRVKQNITGSGRADKGQVMAMVSRLLGIEPQSVDSADALAIAIAASNDRDNEALATESSGSGGLDAAIAHALAKEAVAKGDAS